VKNVKEETILLPKISRLYLADFRSRSIANFVESILFIERPDKL